MMEFNITDGFEGGVLTPDEEGVDEFETDATRQMPLDGKVTVYDPAESF